MLKNQFSKPIFFVAIITLVLSLSSYYVRCIRNIRYVERRTKQVQSGGVL